MTHQMGQMQMGNMMQRAPVQTVNLIGYPLNPNELELPPPDIRLPQDVSFPALKCNFQIYKAQNPLKITYASQ